MRRTLLAALAVSLLWGCTDPKSIEMPDVKAFSESSMSTLDKLPPEDAALLRRYIAEWLETYTDPASRTPDVEISWGDSDRTVGSMLTDAKEYYSMKEKVLAERAEKKRKAEEMKELAEERRIEEITLAKMRADDLAVREKLAQAESAKIPTCAEDEIPVEVTRWYQAPWGPGMAQYQRVQMTLANALTGDVLSTEWYEHDDPITQHRKGYKQCVHKSKLQQICNYKSCVLLNR